MLTKRVLTKSVSSAERGDGLPPAFLRVVGTDPDVPPHTQGCESQSKITSIQYSLGIIHIFLLTESIFHCLFKGTIWGKSFVFIDFAQGISCVVVIC